MQRKTLVLLGHQLLYAEILNGAEWFLQANYYHLPVSLDSAQCSSLKACSAGILTGEDITFLSSGNISRSNKLLLFKSMERCGE